MHLSTGSLLETLETSDDGGGSVVVVGELKTGIGGDCDSVTRDFECGGDGDACAFCS